MTALFTTVFIQQWIDNKNHIPAVLGVAATLVCRLIFGSDIFLIPAMIIIIGVPVLEAPHALPEIIALAAVTGTYIWRRNTILSVVIGTVLYMFLVQSVF